MRPSWPSTSAFELVPVEIVSPTPPNTVAAPLPSITSSLPAMALMLALPVPPLRLMVSWPPPMIVAAAAPPRTVSPLPLKIVFDPPAVPTTICMLPSVPSMPATPDPATIADGTHHGRGAAAQGNELVTGHRIDQRGARRSAQVYSIAGRSNNR